MKEYRVVTGLNMEPTVDIRAFQDRINIFIYEGWECQGGLSSWDRWLYQAMVRDRSEPTGELSGKNSLPTR